MITTGAAIAAKSASQETIGKRVAEGFGRTALDIGILIAMASILGSCLMAARGAERIVFSLQQAIGQQRTPLVFLLSGFVLGIPMFAEAVFYLLLPLAKAMWMKSRRHYLLLVLSIVAGATMTHSLVPPTPGPLFVADAMGIGLADDEARTNRGTCCSSFWLCLRPVGRCTVEYSAATVGWNFIRFTLSQYFDG